MSNTIAKPEVFYPSGDGQPMAETGIHVQAIMWLHQALQDFFRDRPDVFIASDMFWYWEEGNVDARIAPDVMVVPGVGNHHRRSFFTWEENGAVPAVVFEMASQNTWREDLGAKFWRYEELGVREYFLFDPEALYLVPVLQGFRLNRSAYRRLIRDDDQLECELGFRLRAEGMMLRLIDGKTGVPIPTQAEAADAARQAADTARQATDEAKLARDAEKARADSLQAEVEQLRAKLQQFGQANGDGS